MSFSARYLPVLFVFFSLTVSLSAQSPAKQTNKASRGTVSGRVTIKDKGAAGVTVGMRKTEDYARFESFLRATTDQEGFYRITNVTAGSYEAFPSAPGFVYASEMWAQSVIVGEGENVEGINFALIRGGVITGRVTDADERPLIEQPISLYMVGADEQQERPGRMVPSSTAETDDRGIYRLFGLRPGRYKISAGRGDDMNSGNFANTRASYKQVFYPDATDPAKATIIEVREGSEANNTDITLGRPLQTFSVSGRVIDAEKSLPVPNIRFGLQRTAGQRTEFVNAPAASNASGEFVVEGLIPGKYSFLLYPNQNLEMTAETLSFDIIDQDVSNLTIRLTKGASLTGVVVIESEDKAAPEKFSQLKLHVFVMGQSGGGIGSSAPISPDGSFRVAGLPGGPVNMELGGRVGPFPPKGFSISRIERDGTVVSARGLEIKEGEQVTGLRVVLAQGNGTIRGVVKVENGSLPQGAHIYVRLTKTGEHAAGVRPPPVDARGQFLVEGLPPGVYEVLVSIINNRSPQRLNPVRREVNVQDGVVTDVVITFDMSATSPPEQD
jgi:hypothetical protein